MTATKPERPFVRVTDDTTAEAVVELIEARTRRLMAERSRLPQWGDGRRARRAALADIDDSLDEFNRLANK